MDAGVRAVGVEPFGFEHVYDGVCVRHCYLPEATDPCRRTAYAWLPGSTSSRAWPTSASLAGRRVRFCGLPLPVPNSSGSPIRAIAWKDGPPHER